MTQELHVSASRASTHDLYLDDGQEGYYVNLASLDVNESPMTPDTFFTEGGQGSKFGDFTADHAHLLQRDWGGGRAQEEWEDNTKYFDSRMAWGLIPGRITPAPQFRFAEGLRNEETLLPSAKRYGVSADLAFVPMLDQMWYARKVTVSAAANWTLAWTELWVKMVGQPTSTLTVELRNDSSGPGATVHASGTATKANFSDVMSELYDFAMDSAFAMVSGADYWLVVYSTANDSKDNHWEIGKGEGAPDVPMSSTDQGTIWADDNLQVALRVRDADSALHFIDFEFDGSFYLVSSPMAGSASSLYLNGDRGTASSATSTSLVDSTKTWTDSIYVGARVKVLRGPGKGQVRGITSNSTTSLTISPAWDITPTSASDYAIVGTDEWIDISPSSGDQFDDRVVSVAVGDGQVFFAFGTESGDSVILRMRWDSAAHGFDDDPGSNKSDHLTIHYDKVDGPQLWSGENDDVVIRRSDITAWAAALSFGDDIDVGEDTFVITNLLSHEGRLWAFKEDKPWYLQGETMVPVEVGLEVMAEITNGAAAVAWKRDIYFAWAYSMEKMYGQTIDDVGPWQGAGLPAGRQGIISSIVPVHAFLLAAVDAGSSGTSSVLYWNQIGWGELFRATSSGRRIQSMHWQSVPGGDDRLWINVGNDMVVMDFPADSLNFTHSAGFKYHHQWEVISSTYDMEAQQLSKMFKELVATTQNLQEGVQIGIDYQTDFDVGSTEWKTVETLQNSPHQSSQIDEGRRKQIRLRFRGMSDDADVPAIMIAAVLEGYARTPVKYQWAVQITTKGLASTLQGRKADPDEFVTWLKMNSTEAGELSMTASPGFKSMDGLDVVVQPPSIFRQYKNNKSGEWSGIISLAIREA